MGWRGGSSNRVCALQVRSPKLKPQFHSRKKKEYKRNIRGRKKEKEGRQKREAKSQNQMEMEGEG
jgi:hypothetical protein